MIKASSRWIEQNMANIYGTRRPSWESKIILLIQHWRTSQVRCTQITPDKTTRENSPRGSYRQKPGQSRELTKNNLHESDTFINAVAGSRMRMVRCIKKRQKPSKNTRFWISPPAQNLPYHPKREKILKLLIPTSPTEHQCTLEQA